LKKIPRVTEVLKVFSGYDYVAKDILAKAALRGTTVHSVCAGMAKGAWIARDLINEEYHGYISSFKQWSTEFIAEYLIIEQRYISEGPDIFLSGQLDFVARGHDGLTYLVDLKTSASKQKTYPLQMAAYRFLLRLNKIEVDAALIVYLNKDGSPPRVDRYDDLTNEHDIFMSALECWHYFNPGKDTNERTINRKRARAKAEHISTN
jgi:predicted RecB family nuclease